MLWVIMAGDADCEKAAQMSSASSARLRHYRELKPASAPFLSQIRRPATITYSVVR